MAPASISACVNRGRTHLPFTAIGVNPEVQNPLDQPEVVEHQRLQQEVSTLYRGWSPPRHEHVLQRLGGDKNPTT